MIAWRAPMIHESFGCRSTGGQLQGTATEWI